MRNDTKIPLLRPVHEENVSQPHPKSALLALNCVSRGSSYESTVGGIFDDDGYYWMAKGSTLVIASSKSHSVISVYDFNNTFRDLQFSVQTCRMHHNLVIIGLKTNDGKGCVAVYQPLNSQLVKAISIPYPVITLEIVSCVGGAVAETKCLNKNLRYLFGIVSVGTEEGHIYLVDLRLDVQDGIGSLPKPLDILQPASRNVPMMRENASSECKHLAFELQALSHEDGVFHFILPGDEILESFYPSYAAVTSMLYEPRVASIFIGYQFGQFQIFSLQTLKLVYSSEYESHTAPVLAFAFQEPENDPRKYCYLWVAKGNERNEDSDDSRRHPLSISMFQLGYARKNAISTPSKHVTPNFRNNKVQYGDFEVCCQRFQHVLGPSLISTVSQCCETSLLMCTAIEKHAVNTEQQEETEGVDIEYGMSPSSSVCIFGWRSHSDDESSQLHTLVFDINRWYMAQMPRCLTGVDGNDLYVGYWSFDNETTALSDDQIELAMHVPADKIRTFTSGRKPLPEKFIYPSASSFPLQCLTSQHIYNHSLYGHQQQVLNSMHSMKSMCLVSPKEIHGDLLSSSLFTTHKRNQALTPDMMRENILTAALEHGQISFLLIVIKELASGQLAACGCTVRFVMDWAWKSVAHIKSAIDDLSVPIFDCSTATLDVHLKNQLWFNTTLMYHLRIIFQKMLDYTDIATDKSKEELRTKLNVTTLIYQYLKAVQWFISNALLPEQFDDVDNDEEMMTPNGILIYKYSRLRRVFDQRRSELKRLDCPDVLLIDGWIEDIGESLTSRWEKSEGGKPNYPPLNIMTLLDTYYLDCIDVSTKHCLVMYLLNDLVAMLTTLQTEDNVCDQSLHRDRLESIMGFLQSFNVPTSLVKLTQGFWLLDHKHFQEALNIFLDPGTNQAQATWQQRRILKAFLYQAHPAMALKYLSVCQPKIENADDAKMHVTIYIKNREILKAWNLVQMSAGQNEGNEIFSHMFSLSQQHSILDLLLQLPLTSKEECMVVRYLRQSDDAHATQLLILFYLQQNRYIEAIKLHSQTKHIKLMRDQSEESRMQNAKLDHIIQAYINVLPKIERDLLLSSKGFGNRRPLVHKEVHKLTTVPAVLHPASSVGPRSKSERIASLIDKMDRQKKTTQEPAMTPLRRKPFPRSKHGESNALGYPDISRRFCSITGSGVIERSLIESPILPSMATRPHQKPSSHIERRLSSLSVASMLLQTPPIVRKRPSLDLKEFPPPIQTPQSILKVKTKLLKSDWVQTPSPLARGQETLHKIKDNVKDDHEESENDFSETSDQYKTELPVISTPHFNRMKRDPLLCDILQDSAEEAIVRPRPPMISTPTVKKIALGKYEGTDHDVFESTVAETPRKIRFKGLDSSANDSDMSNIGSVPYGQVSGSTQVVMRAEDSEDAEMEVDVLGDENFETQGTAEVIPCGEERQHSVSESEGPDTGTDDNVVLEESGLSEQYLDCEQDTPNDGTINLVSSSEDEEVCSDFKQEDEHPDEEPLKLNNVTISSSDSEAVEADDEQDGDNSEEFSVHEDDDIVEVQSSEEGDSEAEVEEVNDDNQDVDQVLVVNEQPAMNFASGDATEGAFKQNFEIPEVGGASNLATGHEVQFLDIEPSGDDTEPGDVVHDSLLDRGDVEIVPQNIYCNVVSNDPLLPQFEVEDSADSESEEEMITIVQGSIQSGQHFSTQPDTEEELPELVDEEDESSNIRLRLSSTDEEAFPGSSKANEETELRSGSGDVEKVVELTQGVEKTSDGATQDDDATPSHKGDGLIIITEQTMEAATTEQILDEPETNIPSSKKQNDENREHRENITNEGLSSDHALIDNLVSDSDKQADDIPERNVEESQKDNPEVCDEGHGDHHHEDDEHRENIADVGLTSDHVVIDEQEDDVPEGNVKESQKDNAEICVSPVKSPDETNPANPATEMKLEVWDLSIETQLELDSDSQPQASDSQPQASKVTKVIADMATLHGATDQSSPSHETKANIQDMQESDQNDQIKSCEAEQVETSEADSNKHSENDNVVQESDDKVEKCAEQESATLPTSTADPPTVSKMKSEPTFVLSPPASKTRKKRRKRVDNSTQSSSAEPLFLFSPPSTRTRSARKKKPSSDGSVQQDISLAESPELPSKRPRRKTRSSDQDSDRSSPSGRSKTPEVTQSMSTPPRIGRRSPGRKTPGTPTRSSRRIKAILGTIEESTVTSEGSESVDVKDSDLEKKTETLKSSPERGNTKGASELPRTPTRRSKRLSVPIIKTPTRKSAVVKIELSPVMEDSVKTPKRRRPVPETTPSRVTRSAGTSPARTDRKGKAFVPSHKK